MLKGADYFAKIQQIGIQEIGIVYIKDVKRPSGIFFFLNYYIYLGKYWTQG